MSLLHIDNLRIGPGRAAPIVEELTLSVERGETVGLVGESGCGKSLTALSIMGLLPENLRVREGRIRLEGQEIQSLPQRRLRHLRGEKMGMIFQEPLTALNPVMSIGSQITEVLRTHRGLSQRAARDRALDLLTLVKIPDAEARLDDYPHQMSGGMRQRVVIAIALACSPSLLIADEPTTALDVTVQAQILRLLKQLQREENLGLLFITHDLGVVRQVADRIVVMYAGSVVEEGRVDAVLDAPRHPYTAGLIAARPQGSFAAGTPRLADIAGSVPAPDARPDGCVFRARCPRAHPRCAAERPALDRAASGRAVRCHFPLTEGETA
ncbi:ABC transporter ATP-binding protein [Pararhodobacter aggregans]|uniref:Peptide ABC transporter ATP-binding protein n=1 Tax=Pararhodobacter aggregans TaxID=404875 RepID=A0A2T7US44_9RHOB|nr:ABC transporter ATP-binding protein [Pararhodobacter aggregans]PTX00116.1 peptide/nickel transport system ATP-binding protein/dipeptide transport system ATP-binding protein [Pararhodobacter aggregans]PVE47446.1 peptide ABC transporter ATP-binding protein [Pararhodobacter aggregans]